jgi:hypothetical protein
LEETIFHFNTGRRGSIGLSAMLADCTSDTDHQVPSLVGNVAVDDLGGLYCDEDPGVFSLHDSLLDISEIIKPVHVKVEDMKPVATPTTTTGTNPTTSTAFPAISSLENMFLEQESYGVTKEALALSPQERETNLSLSSKPSSSSSLSKKRARGSDDSDDDEDARSTSSHTSSRSSSSTQPARRSYRRLKGTPLINEINIPREMQQQLKQQQGGNKKARTTGSKKGGAQKTVDPEEARLEKNRQSAKECRLRKKEYVNNLERQVSEYQKREKMHLAALEAVKSELSQVQRNFAMLKSRHDEQIRSM